jgi:hypothetical protein
LLSAFPVDPLRLPLLSGRMVAEFSDGAHVDAQF